MKKLLAAAFLTAALAASSARAQEVWISSAPISSSSVVLPYSGSTVPPMIGTAYSPPYSYFAAYPLPPRGYYGYGANDVFPFYGQPYGKPSDRWSWDAMGGSMASRTRYFYPPVR